MQGRVGVFDHATNDTAIELIDQKYALDSLFKTSLQYGLQPLTTSAASLELLKLYVDVVRPKLMENGTDPLFISLTGSAVRIGRYVSAFFKRVCGLHITTTTIRSIIATESACLFSNGKISASARDSIQNINGHSGITAQKYYQKRSRIDDMENASTVINQLLSSPSCPIDLSQRFELEIEHTSPELEIEHTSPELESTLSPVIYCPSTSLVAPEFDITTLFPVIHGPSTSLHGPSTSLLAPVIPDNIALLPSPCIDSVRKVAWTETEIQIVGNWCNLYRQQHPGSKTVVASCLQHIRRDKAVEKHFHPHHIADSTRLRWGWQKFQEQEGQAAAHAAVTATL